MPGLGKTSGANGPSGSTGMLPRDHAREDAAAQPEDFTIPPEDESDAPIGSDGYLPTPEPLE